MSINGQLIEVPLKEIEPWPDLNPRTYFAEAELQELATSIKKDGLLQPVAAAPAGEGAKKGVRYWLFVGERRLRASKLAKAKTIKVIVADVDETTAHRLAGLENLARANLTVMEEARWLKRELELTGLTQRKLAQELKKSQAWIANRLRFLELPTAGQAIIEEGLLAPATARDLLLRFGKLDEDLQGDLFDAIGVALKKAAKDEQPVPMERAQEAIGAALEKAGAVECSSGYSHVHGVGYANISEALRKTFTDQHAGRCVQAGDRWNREVWWTFEKKAWTDLVREKAAEQQKRSQESSYTAQQKKQREKAKDPKLGPDKKPTTLTSLQSRFGHDHVLELSKVPDPSGIDPSHVARAKVDEWGVSGGKSVKTVRETLLYVGPDAKKMLQAHGKLVNAEVERVGAAEARKVLAKAAALSDVTIIRGLLAMMFEADFCAEIQECVVADGHVVPESWDSWEADGHFEEIEIDDAAVRRIAGALTLHASAGDNHDRWEADRARRREATKRIEAEGRKRAIAWAREHMDAEKIPAGIATGGSDDD